MLSIEKLTLTQSLKPLLSGVKRVCFMKCTLEPLSESSKFNRYVKRPTLMLYYFLSVLIQILPIWQDV